MFRLKVKEERQDRTVRQFLIMRQLMCPLHFCWQRESNPGCNEQDFDTTHSYRSCLYQHGRQAVSECERLFQSSPQYGQHVQIIYIYFKQFIQLARKVFRGIF